MSSNKNNEGSSSFNPNSNIRRRFWRRPQILNTHPPLRPRAMSHLVRPVRPPPPTVPAQLRPVLQGSPSSAFSPYVPNQGMALVPDRPLPQSPTGLGTHDSSAIVPDQGMGLVPYEGPREGSVAGPLVPHSSTGPDTHGGEAEGGSEAGALVVYNPDTVPDTHVGGAEGGSEAGALVVYNPDMVSGVHVGGSEGGSGAGALVMYTGRPLKQARREKEVVASGSGTGQDENRKKCSICGKAFASEKAVFGHMRLHRNRGWRGAHPPPVFNAEEEFADVPGLNLPLVIREEVVGGEEGRAAAEAAAAERAAAVEAEEAERALVVERRRGVRIDLNVDLWKQAPDDAPDA